MAMMAYSDWDGSPNTFDEAAEKVFERFQGSARIHGDVEAM